VAATARAPLLAAGATFARCGSGSRTRRALAARSRRSPTTASCRTARRRRWSRPTATSSGCACPGWTPPACSARCSTATRATSAWAPRASRCPRAAATSRARWCSRRAGARAAAG
jgi:hypothetical protein